MYVHIYVSYVATYPRVVYVDTYTELKKDPFCCPTFWLNNLSTYLNK